MRFDRPASILFLACCVLIVSSPACAADAPVHKVADAAPPAGIPFRADAGLTKAEGQIARGDYAQALDTLTTVTARRPADADALAYAGYAWFRLGDMKKAVGAINTALQYDPRHMGANLYKARLFLAAGDRARALEQMQAIRMICGTGECAELSTLQAELNAPAALP